MRQLLRRLWDDDGAAVISVELVLIIAILIFGMIPGLVALRNSGIAVLTSLGNLAATIIPSFTFSGFQIVVSNGTTTTTIGQVGGFQFSPSFSSMTGSQIPPVPLGTAVVVPPAP
jgi:hypothetical protein